MKITDARCSACGAEYERAEFSTLAGRDPEIVRCGICSAPLPGGSRSRFVLYRLIVAPDRRSDERAA